MEFNEYIRWAAEDLEKLEKAEEACMEMYGKTGSWEWVQTASSLRRQADNKRLVTSTWMGWYLV